MKCGEYLGHKIEISECGDSDCSKAWHEVTLPDGTKRTADISPYDWSFSTVELWIDAGYPTREVSPNPTAPWHREDLVKVGADAKA